MSVTLQKLTAPANAAGGVYRDPETNDTWRPIIRDGLPGYTVETDDGRTSTVVFPRHACPLETENGVTPGVVTYCGLPSAPGHTWCREHLYDYGITEDL